MPSELQSWSGTSSQTAKGILRDRCFRGGALPVLISKWTKSVLFSQEGVLGFCLEGLGLPGRFHIDFASVPPHRLEI